MRGGRRACWYGGLGAVKAYSGWTSTGQHDRAKAVSDARDVALQEGATPFLQDADEALPEASTPVQSEA